MRAARSTAIVALVAAAGFLGLGTGCKAKASAKLNTQADAEAEAKVRAGEHESWSETDSSRHAGDPVVQGAPQEQGRAIEPAEGGMPAGGPPSATFPGFRMLADGRSRVFVELHGRVEVDQSASEGRLSYKLKGAKVPYRVNGMSLPTGHFETPVARVRLVGTDEGADLIIDLRRQVQPQVNLRASDNGTTLSIDFPKLSDADAKVVAEANKVPKPDDEDNGPPADGSQ